MQISIQTFRCRSVLFDDCVIGVAVPVQLVDMYQLDIAGNWTASEPEHPSTAAVLSKEAKVLGKYARALIKYVWMRDVTLHLRS